MSTFNEFPICTVCAVKLDPHSSSVFDNQFPRRWSECLWKQIAVAFEGPYWPKWGPEPASLSIPDDAVSLRFAEVERNPALLVTLPDGQVLEPQTFDDETSRGIVGIHFACLDLASRVIKTSQLANISSIGDLWVTLERRCAIIDDGNLYGSYLPAIPNGPNIRDDQPHDLENLDMKRYYHPMDNCYGSVGLLPYRLLAGGCLESDPLHIPDLTSRLVSDLKPHEEQESHHTRFNELFRGLPREVKHQIVDLLPQGSLPLDCNYLMPQEEWKHVFVRIPFLWDLDHEAIYKKALSAPPNTEWNWEKLTHQVISPVTVAEGLGFSAEAWSYG
ncbi:hypothetical protein MRS44_009356 [Fusarium solani]|uniref:uncharacterized protein n=1 Tax=Fusarium solani TaxID=169388 RepID=UPI0032C3F2A4|nr:hypothetical protein MRS44_009356 [Fusarium solani]